MKTKTTRGNLKKLIHSLETADPAHFIVLLLFLAHFFLDFYAFFPNLGEINFWDEAIYVNNGRLLIEGNFPILAQNPLLSIFYGVLYLPFYRSPYWLVQICSVGRLIMFCLIWLGGYLAAQEMKRVLDLPVAASLLFVVPMVTELLGNLSDAMFTAMSGFALWQLLKYCDQKNTRNLMLSSLFIGLAALARTDGLLLFVIFFVLSIFLSRGKANAWKKILAGTLPFLGLVGGYIVLSGVINGDFSTGIVQRSYVAFEQGHEGVLESGGIYSNTIDAVLDAREKFGSAEENDYSVFTAIRRNPSAYLVRLKDILRRLPEQLLTVYNKKMAPLLFLAVLWGIITLVRKKNYPILAILVAYPAYLLVYFLTFFREGYLRTPFLPVFLLAAVGFTDLFDNLKEKKILFGASISLGILIFLGLIFDKLAVYYGAVLFLASMGVVVWVRKRFHDFPKIRSVSLLVMLMVGLVLHGNYASPKIQRLGQNADERAAVYLREYFPRGTKVGAGSPAVVWMSKLEFMMITGADVPAFERSEDFYNWLCGEGIQAVYLDYSISNQAPFFWELIKQESGHGLTEVFNENAGSNRIYIVEAERK